MPIKENYERLSLRVNNMNAQNFIYEIKMYLENVFDYCDVSYFYLVCDGEELHSYENLEQYTTINFILRYHTKDSQYGIDFYRQYCKNFSKKELQLFGITNLELPNLYMYNGCQITNLKFENKTTISDQYQIFEAQPLSVIFQIPENKEHEHFLTLLKKWVEIGSEFYEQCSDIEIIDGYISYLVEPYYSIDRNDFTKVIELYNQLIDLLIDLNGRLINVQTLFVSYHSYQDIVIRIEKNNVGIYTTEPFFYPVLN